jgi:hypothetical protein
MVNRKKSDPTNSGIAFQRGSSLYLSASMPNRMCPIRILTMLAAMA